MEERSFNNNLNQDFELKRLDLNSSGNLRSKSLLRHGQFLHDSMPRVRGWSLVLSGKWVLVAENSPEIVVNVLLLKDDPF